MIAEAERAHQEAQALQTDVDAKVTATSQYFCFLFLIIGYDSFLQHFLGTCKANQPWYMLCQLSRECIIG